MRFGVLGLLQVAAGECDEPGVILALRLRARPASPSPSTPEPGSTGLSAASQETFMKDESANLGGPSADCCNSAGHGTANPEPGILGASGAALPPVVDRVAFESELNRLQVREKAVLAGVGGAGQVPTGTVPADAACGASAGAVRFDVLGPLLVADDAGAARGGVCG